MVAAVSTFCEGRKRRMNISSQAYSNLRRELKERGESLPIYIAVDATKIARCKWCGSAESEEWIPAQQGLYCSGDCSQAANAGGLLVIYCLLTLTMPMLLLLIGPIQPTTFAIGSSLFIIMATPFLYCEIQAQSKKKRIPKRQSHIPWGIGHDRSCVDTDLRSVGRQCDCMGAS